MRSACEEAAIRSPASLHIRSVYYGSRVVSQAAKALFFASLLFTVGEGDSIALGLSSIAIAMLAASVVFGLPGGALVDRMGPGVGLAAGSVLRCAVVAWGLASMGDPDRVWLLAFVYSAVSQLHAPAEMALVRGLHLRCANSAHASLIGLQFAGQAAGALALVPALYVLGGEGALLPGALVCYLLAAGFAIAIAAATRRSRCPGCKPARDGLDLTAAVRFFGDEPQAAYAAGLLAFAELATRTLVVALPLYLQSDLDLGNVHLGVAAGLAAAGAVAGLAWSGHRLSIDATSRAMRSVLVATVLAVLVLSGLTEDLGAMAGPGQAAMPGFVQDSHLLSFALASTCFLVLGVAFGASSVAGRAVLSLRAPAGQQARVFAAQAVMTDLLIIAPLALAGLSTEALGARTTLLSLAAVGAVVLVFLERRSGARAPALAVQPLAQPVVQPVSAS